MALVLCLSCSWLASAQDVSQVIPPSGVIGVQDAMLAPNFWITRAHLPESVLLTPAQITARNQATSTHDPALVDLAHLPATLTRPAILQWVKDASSPLNAALVDAEGSPIPSRTLAAIRANMGIDRIPASEPIRYGMAVRRAQLRTYPTAVGADVPRTRPTSSVLRPARSSPATRS